MCKNDLTVLAEYNIQMRVTRADIVKAKLRNFTLKKKKREIYIPCLYLRGGDPEAPLCVVTRGR